MTDAEPTASCPLGPRCWASFLLLLRVHPTPNLVSFLTDSSLHMGSDFACSLRPLLKLPLTPTPFLITNPSRFKLTREFFERHYCLGLTALSFEGEDTFLKESQIQLDPAPCFFLSLP